MSVWQKKFVTDVCIHSAHCTCTCSFELCFSVCSEYVLACTEDVPTCGDTCDKVHLVSHDNSNIGA